MSIRALVVIVLAGFLALTARALSHYGYFEFLQAVTANAVLSVLFFDLVISLSLRPRASVEPGGGGEPSRA